MVSRLMLSTGVELRQLAILNPIGRDPLSGVIGGDVFFWTASSV